MLYFLYYFQAVTTALAQVDREKIYQWINELSSPETRENALLELSKKRESVPDLAPMLWHSCGTIAALLQVSQGSVFHRSYLTCGGARPGWAGEAERLSEMFPVDVIFSKINFFFIIIYIEPGNSCFTCIFMLVIARKLSTSTHRSTPPPWQHTSPTEYVMLLHSSSVWPPIQRQGNWIPCSYETFETINHILKSPNRFLNTVEMFLNLHCVLWTCTLSFKPII